MNGNDPKKTYNLGLLPEIEISTSKDGKVNRVEQPKFAPTKELKLINNNSTPLKNKFASSIGLFASNHAESISKITANREVKKAVDAVIKKGERNTDTSAPAIKKAWDMYKPKTNEATVSGQYIGKDSRALYDIKDGPRKGDKIKGKHLKFDGSGYVVDNNYQVKLKRSTKKGNIYKTTGIK